MNWGRLVVGRPGQHLGKSRWPLTTVLALFVAIFSALAEDWRTFGFALAAAILFGILTVRSLR